MTSTLPTACHLTISFFDTLGVKICLAIAEDGRSRLAWNTVFQEKWDCCHLNQCSCYCPAVPLTWGSSHFFYIIQMVVGGPRICRRWKIGWTGVKIPSLQLLGGQHRCWTSWQYAILGLLCAPVSPGKLTGSPNQTRVKWSLVCFQCFIWGRKRLVCFSPGTVPARQMIQRCKWLTRHLLRVHILSGMAYALGVTRNWALWVAQLNA